LSQPTVYNHDVMNCTADGVSGNYLYSARALGVTRPGDKIQFHPDLKPQLKAILAHYERIGLPVCDDYIWGLDRAQLGQYSGYEPSVFYFGPNEAHFWDDSAWLDTVEFINSKNQFMALAKELDIAIPRTDCYADPAQISEQTLAALPYPLYVKAAISVSGVGIYRCENAAAARQAVNSFAAGTPLQLQEEVLTPSFLNLQYQEQNGKAVRLAASEQILDGFAHQGNRVSAAYEPWGAVDAMADWLVDKGIRGVFAFDVAVVEDADGAVRFPAIECNPRFNGASYPTLIAQKLGIHAWEALTVETRHRHLNAVDLAGLEYSAASGEGIIIVNWGTILIGKLVVLFVGSEQKQKQLKAELDRRLR